MNYFIINVGVKFKAVLFKGDKFLCIDIDSFEDFKKKLDSGELKKRFFDYHKSVDDDGELRVFFELENKTVVIQRFLDSLVWSKGDDEAGIKRLKKALNINFAKQLPEKVRNIIYESNPIT